MRRFVSESSDLSRVREVFGLTLLSALLSTTLSATVGALTVTKWLGVGSFGEIWLLWWSCDVLGVMLLAPVILSWRKTLRWVSPGKPATKQVEAVAFMVVLNLSAVYILQDNWHQNLAFKYLFLPFLIWSGYRFGVRSTAVAGLWVALLTTWFTIMGHSDIAQVGLSPRKQVAALQLFLAVITLTGLFLAAALAERRRAEEDVRESEEIYRAMFENNQAVKLLIDPQTGFIVEANSAAADYYGYPLKQLREINISEINTLPLEEAKSKMKEAKQSNCYHYYFSHRLATGEIRDVEVFGGPLVLRERELLFSIIHDISERKRAETALEESEKKFHNLFNNAQVGIFRTKVDGSEILDMNDKFLEIFGWSREEMVNLPSVILWADPREREESVHLLETEGRVTDFECRMMTKQGEVKHCLASLRIYPEEGNLEGSIIDITERKRAEELIRVSLKEKEILLKEIHHRVKNNLAVIGSILRLQSQLVEDTNSLEIFRECENRVKTMAKIHSKLYQSKDLACIDIDSYLRDLTEDLFQSYQVNSENLAINLQVADVKLDIHTTVPLCLILNELFSNALKYAFPNLGRGEAEARGEIKITLSKEDGQTVLIVADNGIGFPDQVDFKNTKSLGLQLVMALIKQLHGTIEMQREKGTVFIIRLLG
jgi:PAS domain S-box-containing protein